MEMYTWINNTALISELDVLVYLGFIFNLHELFDVSMKPGHG